MGVTRFFREAVYYFLRLPFFSALLRFKHFEDLGEVFPCCPAGPRSAFYINAVHKACGTHPFLKDHDPGALARLYTVISTIREADTFTFPFLNSRTLGSFNTFENTHVLTASYGGGALLLLYSHTGSHYQGTAAVGSLGCRIFPLANWVDPSTLSRPFRWVYLLNMALSERCHSGGRYLYLNTPSFALSLRDILLEREGAVILAALDLPPRTAEKRHVVPFLDGYAAFPYRLVESFLRRRLPIVMALPSVRVEHRKITRVLEFVEIPAGLSATGVVEFYGERLSDFVFRHPEQFMNLINLEEFYA